MRPAEFAPQSIIEAGQELQSAGRNITGFALRQKVGGGNPSRLKQVWDEHLASQSVTKAEPVSELPVEVAEEVAAVTKALTERLAALAVELNDKAVKAADRRVHEVVRSAGEQRAQAERELADAAETVDDLESKLDETHATGQMLETKLADSHAVSQTQAVELAQIRERLTVTEQAARASEVQHVQSLKAMTEQHTAELDRMNAATEADRNRHQQEADQLRTELVEHKKTAQAIAADRDQVRAELATAKAKAEVAEQSHQEQRKTADQEAKRVAERIAKAEADQVQARTETSTAREDAAKLRGQVEAMQTQTAELMRVLSERSDAIRTQSVS
jgi:chromosome segregation ATPase